MLPEHYVLHTLGGLSLENGGRPITGAAAQRGRLALLAAIASAGDRGISRDRLLALFWSESDTERARGALKQALYSLRRDVGERDLTLGNTELRLNPMVIKGDVAEFEAAIEQRQLLRAVQLYHGPFLDGIHLHDSPEFERWAERERDRLATSYRGALTGLARSAAAADDPATAVAWWRKAAAAEPLSASVATSLMEALLAAGDSAGALRHAQVYTTLVRAELDAAPDPTVTALVERIRSAKPTPPNGGNGVHREADEARQRVDADLPAEGAVPSLLPGASPASLRRSPLLIGGTVALGLALLGSAALAAWGASHRSLDPHRIVLRVGSASTQTAQNAPLAELLRDQLAAGISETRLATVLPVRVTPDGQPAGTDFTPESARSVARAARGRYVVLATYEVEGDSLRVSAQIADAQAGLLLPIEAVRGLLVAPERAVAALRSRVLAVLAGRLDPRLRSWAFAAALPDTYQGVEQLRLGIDAFAHGDNPQAMLHFRAAAALDSTSATPLVWAAYAWAHSPDGAQWGTPDFALADSIVKVLEASHRRSDPWDTAVLGEVKAFIGGDLGEAHAAAHRVLQLVPNSEWAIMLAYDAFNVGRADEAVQLLRKADSKQGWIGGWGGWGRTLHMSYHFLGDYQSQLKFARAALRSEPENNGYLQIEVTALGALGRGSEIEQRCAQSWRRGQSAVCDQGIVELLAHGYPEAARRLFQVAELYETDLENGKTKSPLDRAARLADFGFVAAADSLMGEHPLRAAATKEEMRLVRDLALAHGDRAAGELARRELDSLANAAGPLHRDEWSFRRAELAGWLGDRDAVVFWLTRAYSEGLRHRSIAHWDPAFLKLHGYPPFDALLRPVDDPETIPPP